MSYAQEIDTLSALYDVSIRGSVNELKALIAQDPLILHKLSLTTFTETPLHISALLGHLDFTKSLLTHLPQLALELDYSKRTPLHLASANGHIEIVNVLLQTCEQACLVSDQDGRIPLHYAAMRGRTEIGTMLIGAKPESLTMLDGSGKTTLHLCVEHNHLETLKTLVQVGDVSADFLNFRDSHHGNTILHLAVILKQVETTGYLLSISKIREEANMLNKMGCTALEMLEHSPKDWRSHQIKLMLMDGSGIKNNVEKISQTQPLLRSAIINVDSRTTTVDSNEKYWKKWFKRSKKFLQHQGDRLEHMRGMLSLVATMITTMTFDAITNVGPPNDSICLFYYNRFIACNSISFVTSLSITLLLVSGVPLKNEVTMGILSLGTGVTLTFLMLSYQFGVFMLNSDFFLLSRGHIIFYWLGFLGLIGSFIIVRVIYWLIKVMKHGANVHN